MDIGSGWMRVLPGLAALCLGACVTDPYIAHRAPGDGANPAYGLVDATAYAGAARDRMASKAKQYAVLNNGGGALLLNVAGLAAYRGFQGGHEANIAALATGGAAFYGTQQYLYRKPREAIYWAGAGALTCAIGVATRADVGYRETGSFHDELAGVKAKRGELPALRSALQGVLRSGARVCRANAKWKALKPQAAQLLGDTADDAVSRRARNIQGRVQRLELAGKFAAANLVNATDAIVDTVNGQLAAEQPDPAELATLISRLKMPALEAAAVPAAPAEPETEPAAGEDTGKNGLFESQGGLGTLGCQPQAAEAAYRDLDAAFAFVDETFSSVESRLGMIEANVAPPADATSKLCSVSRGQALLPFALAPAQAGTQALAAGGTLLVPIVGGVAPFQAIPAAVPATGTLAAVAEATDDGSYRFRVQASEDAAPGTYALIGSDAAGVARPFQVRVEAGKTQDK